jgi:hypothetical protein
LTAHTANISIRAHPRGAVAQLGERDVRNVEVSGSIPLGSTILFNKISSLICCAICALHHIPLAEALRKQLDVMKNIFD